MNLSAFRFDGDRNYKADEFDTSQTPGANKQNAAELLEKAKERIGILQEKLFAQSTQSLLVVFQGMDTSGKDGTIQSVFSNMNPEWIHVANFKTPTGIELAHDYLWRVCAQLPTRGYIGVFNRSYYEDVLVAKVLDLPKSQPLPDYSVKDVWEKRYRQINDFERYLTENGTQILKIFLNISKEEQHERLLARLDEPAKNWKFQVSDLISRTDWDNYMQAYECMIKETSNKLNPWHVIPADKKWYARLAVAQLVADKLKDMKPDFPKITPEQKKVLDDCRILLKVERQSHAELLKEMTEKKPTAEQKIAKEAEKILESGSQSDAGSESNGGTMQEAAVAQGKKKESKDSPKESSKDSKDSKESSKESKEKDKG